MKKTYQKQLKEQGYSDKYVAWFIYYVSKVDKTLVNGTNPNSAYKWRKAGLEIWKQTLSKMVMVGTIPACC